MGGENTILVQLLVKIAVIASMASIALRFSFAKRMLLREQAGQLLLLRAERRR